MGTSTSTDGLECLRAQCVDGCVCPYSGGDPVRELVDVETSRWYTTWLRKAGACDPRPAQIVSALPLHFALLKVPRPKTIRLAARAPKLHIGKTSAPFHDAS
eukprot:m.139571 g.139571  ORF g.139571 m.139571 type:complete len:102 (-) comp14019_c0_seq4:3227-3532(-)